MDCRSGNEAVEKFLLKHGVDRFIKNKNNRTALFSACMSGNVNI